MSVTDRTEWRLFGTDLVTQVGVLPAQSSNLYFEVSEPGSGTLTIPLDSIVAPQVTEGMLCVCFYRGASRGSFFVDNLKTTEADSNEGAGRLMTLSGRGGLGLLEMARVVVTGSGDSTRAFTGATKASILIVLIQEAQARGGLAASLTWDFTDTDDSDSVAWTDSEELTIPVGTTLLAVLRQFAKASGIDFSIAYSTGGFVLSAYKDGIGTNKPDVIMAIGENCEEVSRDIRGGQEVENALLVKWQDGYITVEDAPSIALRGRREGFLSLEAAQSAESALTFASAQLEGTKDPQSALSIKVWDGKAPYLFLDYELGDTVSLNSFGTVTSDRIRGIQANFNGDEWSHVLLKMNTIIYENNMRMSRDLEWLLNQWNTARDGNLLEVRSWVALGLPSDIAAPGDAYMDGDNLYICGNITKVGGLANANINARYNMVSGEWFPIVGLGFEECVIHIGDWTYFGFTASTTFAYRVNDDGVTPSEIYLSGGSPANTYDFETDGTYLFVCGNFGSEYGANTQGIFKVHLGTDVKSAIGAGLNQTIYSLYWDGSNLFAGGDGAVFMWDGATWTEISSGGGIDGKVYAIVKAGNTLYVGGDFTGFFAVWDNVDTFTAIAGINGIVNSLTSYLADVNLGGEFTQNVIRYSGGVFISLEGGTSGEVNAVVMHGSTLIAVGDYVSAGVVSAMGVAAYFTNFQALLNEFSNNSTYDLGNGIHTATAVTSLDSGDEFPLWDSATQLLRKITFGNMWLSIKALADTFYVALTGDQTVAGIKRFSDSIEIGVAPPSAEADGGMSQGSEGASVGNLLYTWGTAVSSFITGVHARGSKASPTATNADDNIFRLRARAHDGSVYGNTSAEIRLIADETHDGSGHGTRIEFWTTPNNSTTLTKVFTINSDGNVNIESGKTYNVNGSPY